jgi:phosphatidylserine decarboxylase
MTIRQRLFLLLQHCLPKRLIGRCVYWAVRWRFPPLKNFLISRFVRHYDIDMSEASEPNPSAYPTFNAFFTRTLKPDARAVDRDVGTVIAPADGTLTQWGSVAGGRIIQAKGLDYSVDDLLGDARPAGAKLADASFATIYLAPYNYHRVHTPIAGRLTGLNYIPGECYSVNATTAQGIENLFPRNERVVCWFEGEYGAFALVLVGAFNVATMSTVWTGEINAQKQSQFWSYDDPALEFDKADQIGHFNLGSTVIMVCSGALRWLPSLQTDMSTRMGMALAHRPHA